MLSIEENAKLSEVGRGTAMGELMRRYWIPFRLSSDLPEPDGDPVKVTLLGESLVAYRETSGKVCLIQRHCAHRWSDLFYGRNEEGGLRCTYHGWKYDGSGRCIDMPTETEDSSYKDKIRITAYPVEESGGVLWTYMGPPEFASEMPRFEYLNVPEDHRHVSWNWQENNFAQAIEGGIDSAHSNFLHASLDAYWRTDAWLEQGKRSGNLRDLYHARDQHPKFFSEDTDYGVMTGARRDTGEGQHYWRFNLFLMPFYTMPPSAKTLKFFHAFVPIDDVNVQRWTFTWSLDAPLRGDQVQEWRKGSGLHAALEPGPDHIPLRRLANDYLIDRGTQRTRNFTGITGTGEQDFSVQEGMGPLTPRHKEHLGTTDVGIIKMRRRLLRDATALEDGDAPRSAADGGVYHLRSGDILLESSAHWIDDARVREIMTATW